MPPFGFCGGTYQSESVNVDAQRCMNFYPETNGRNSASPIAMYQRAGRKQFADLGTGPVGGLFKYQPKGSPFPRVFAVASNFSEVFTDGTHHDYTFVSTSLPVTMAANNANQIIVCTGGDLWCFNTTTNTATQVATNLGKKFASVGFLNGFFLALEQNSQTVWFSAVEDGTSWDALDFFAVSLFPDNVLSMIVDHGLIWLHGLQQAAVYYNTTDPLNPFLPATTQPIEQGTGAPYSVVKLDNSIFWIGADDRGQGVAWRANGYVPTRVSTFAIETAWQKYSTISDAVGYTYQENGHPFWVIYFPTASKTWAYDPSTGFWHERGYGAIPENVADRGRCHVFAFGKHLVGDTQSGKIWDMSTAYTNDAGAPIIRYRRAPHLMDEHERLFISALEVRLESGIGPSIPESIDAPSSFILQDSSEQLWSIYLDASYIINSTAVASGSVTSVILQDLTDPSQFWQLGINPDGMLTTTSTATPGPTSFVLVTTAHTLGQITVSGGLLQSGAGGDVPVTYRGPYVYLRWSDDGGHTWKSQQFRDAGKLGEYSKRVIWHRLGKSRDRVFEFGTSEDFSCRIVDAYVDLTKGSAPKPQYA